jgi:hypothetical protein
VDVGRFIGELGGRVAQAKARLGTGNYPRHR